MNEKMMEILKKAKAVEKYTDNKFGKKGAPSKPSNGGGLYEQMDGTQLITTEQAVSSGGLMDQIETSMGGGSTMVDRMDASSPVYESSVKKSKLPDAVKKAMMENPIPQPGLVDDFSPEMVNEIRGHKMTQEMIEPEVYSEDDEKDFYKHPIPPKQTQQRKQVVNENVASVGDIRKMIAEEIYKALPIVIEDYFDKRVLKENIQFKAGNTTFSGTVSPLPKKKVRK